jgi:RNA polymerase sigma factor (sigma-70 family)
MSVEREDIERGIEAALMMATEFVGADVARKIKPILSANLDRGRVQYFLAGDPDRIHAYVRLVADNFTKLNPYLHQLQSEQDTEVWAPLYERMQTWAYNFLLRKNFPAGRDTCDLAVECATEAAIHLLHSHFPYDTGFDPWAHILVQNACRKFIQGSLKKSVVPQEKQVELKDGLADPNNLSVEAQLLMTELGAELETALEQLSEARRSLIRMLYFEGLEPQEAASRLGKSIGAVYSLNFNALHDLRKILSTIRDNLNE